MTAAVSTRWDATWSEHEVTLAGEHAVLLRDVRRRADAVTALIDAHTWPDAELGTLTAFLRAEVLRQASDEETLLYPGDATTGPFAELSADHALLYTLCARLEDACAEPNSLPELRATIDKLLTTLRRHLTDEQAVLAALAQADTPVPAAAEVGSGEQSWPAGDTGPVRILLDLLPAEHAAQLCIERLLRLRPGQEAEVRARDAEQAQRVCRWLHGFDSARFGLSHSRSGDGHSLLYVSRRAG
jgi:HPt (histidine-containing phosphotransfer) domain-containing protein